MVASSHSLDRTLERANLVRRRRSGREHLLSYNPKPFEDAATWMESQRALWTSRLDALDVMLTAEDRKAAKAPRKRGRSHS